MQRDDRASEHYDQARLQADLDQLSAELVGLRRDHERLSEEYHRAEAAARAKDRLIAHVSHELRTPMNGILGITGLTLETDLNEEQRRYLRMVWSSADSLITIVNDLLDHAKLEAGKLALEDIDFNLSVVLADTVSSLRVVGEQKGIRVSLSMAPSVPDHVSGDPSRLRQIVVNLVGNALKFTPSGEVTVAVDVAAEDGTDLTVAVAVSDTGIGIPPDRLDAVFDPYEQASASISREYGGTGLGLSICAQLARAMGGDISVESEVGKGSTFRFTVRLCRVDAPPDVGPTTGSINVLAAGDTPVNHRVIVEALANDRFSLLLLDDLSDLQHRITTAADAGSPYDVLVLDLQENTMQRLEQLIADLDVGEASILVLTATGQRGDAARCRAIGVGGYLTAPITEGEIAEGVKAVHAGTPGLVTRHWIHERTRRLKVLVVDDSPTNRLLAGRIVEKQGHLVTTASGGEEAIAAIAADDFDVVLLDLEMPGMDGFATAAAIRALEYPKNEVPIAAVTGHVGEEHRTMARAAGMQGFLTKPFRNEELAATIADLV